MSSDRTPTHIGHKAGCQHLLEHRVPVHVGQVGCTLNVTEAGQAALGVLGQELRTQGRGACLSCVPTEVRGVVRVGPRENGGASALLCSSRVVPCLGCCHRERHLHSRLHSREGPRGQPASARPSSTRPSGRELATMVPSLMSAEASNLKQKESPPCNL